MLLKLNKPNQLIFGRKHHVWVRNHFLVLFCIICLNLNGYCQSPDAYLNQFYSSTFQPEELNVSSSKRLEELFEYYSKQNEISSKLKKQEYEEFVYRSNYFLEKLNKSGEVFYGDTISKYLNKVKDFLLEDHPRQKDIKVLLTRHPTFNAFTNDFGNIYVNITTLSSMKNEIQLLALLAHEISHILNNHTHEFEEFRKKIESDDWLNTLDKKVLKSHAFSQEQEYEADLDGFKLLKKKGVDLNTALALFDQLQFDLNPNLSGEVDLHLFAGANQFVIDYMGLAVQNIDSVYKNIKANETDSLTTHPSTAKRKEAIAKFIADSKFSKDYQAIGNFEFYSNLADFILINTYIENGWYIECLDHVLKLRKEYPNNNYLIKSQAKIFLLLTQAKYDASPFDQFVNGSGNHYTDTSYLVFKESVQSLNALETNLISLLVIEELKKQNSNPYLNRVHNFLIQFLYKYNPYLFSNKEGEITYLGLEQIDSSRVRINNLDPDYNLTKTQWRSYKKLKKKGFLRVRLRESNECLNLVKHFVKENQLKANDLAAINQYKIQRARFERMLTIDELDIQFDPFDALLDYRPGVYTKSNTLNQLDSIALVQTTSMHVSGKFHEYTMDYKKSLDLEYIMVDVLKSNTYIDKNFSNSAISDLGMADINQHYYLLLWVNERFKFNDLIYSAVDEQILDFKSKNDIMYLMYNINVTSRKKGLRNKHASFGYNVFFDLESEGINYISKIASKQKGNHQVFKQLFHLTNYQIK